MGEELEEGWVQRQSRSKPGMNFYVHLQSGKTQLDPPLRKRKRADSDPSSSAAAAPNPLDGLYAGLEEAATTAVAPLKKEKIEERKKAVTSVKCLHLLKKHTGSRRPSSWRQAVITRSPEEATYQLKEFRKQLAACATDQKRKDMFEGLARKESDCSSANDGGSLGTFKHGVMQPSFEEAAFKLEVNELSGIVSTDSGMHLILRLA
eukprot:gnl/TRDRNA2_/TRDRNA2_58877_c0_seq1.p1 gnl/TRDRNA2_/TRDRNA2_58877_c0~~gnl/TRDRNA2_/TRDRNA2_58877_c0_seq1.p1  ORF type:complete len:206 (-),score=37.82 gnl/TRDRNA2_/TRDRNA2_58877_c0_seq1:110-727(-)